MKNYCPKCRYFFGTTKNGKCPDCKVLFESPPQNSDDNLFRMLEGGEEIKEGDEGQSESGWVRLAKFPGAKYVPELMVPIRRKTQNQ